MNANTQYGQWTATAGLGGAAKILYEMQSFRMFPSYRSWLDKVSLVELHCVHRPHVGIHLPCSFPVLQLGGMAMTVLMREQVVVGRQGEQMLTNEAGDVTRCALGHLERTPSSASPTALRIVSRLASGHSQIHMMRVLRCVWC